MYKTNKALASLFQKAKTLIKVGTDPLMEGINNYNTPIEEIEVIAQHRAQTCVKCPHYQLEEFKMLQVSDQRIPELNNMKCGECGCLLPYKTRQLTEKCNKWDI